MQENKTYFEIEELKNRIINLSLIISTSIGFITYFLSLTEYDRHGLRPSYFTDLAVLLVILGVTIYRKRISVKIKTYLIIGGIFIIIIFDVIHLGVFSANKVLVVLVPFFAALAISTKKAVGIFVIFVISFLIIGYFHLTEILQAPSQENVSFSAWIINILLITIVTIIVLVIQNKFNQTYVNLILNLEKTNELVSEQERNYREIFNSSTDAIFIHDLKGQILDVNNSMLLMYGYEREDIDDLDVNLLSSGKGIYTGNEAAEYVIKAINGDPQIFDWQARKKVGDFFWVEVALKKTSIGGIDRVLAVVRDINEKKEDALQLEMYRVHLKDLVYQKTKELEQTNEELLATNDNLAQQKEELQTTVNELQKTQDQLVQSEKMASLGILAAGVAHEINNPLNFIQGGLFGLENYFDEELKEHEESVKPLLSAIGVGVERAADIVSSLNHYSRKDNSKVEKCNIHEIIDNSLVILHNKVKHKAQIQKEYTNADFELIGNEGQLHQVFINILLNAAQSISDKGNIKICTNIAKDNLQISILDSGDGISKENLAKIYDPFFTTKDAGEGTGLGMSISLKIIEDHKGKIEYKSELKKGTEVIISLPIN